MSREQRKKAARAAVQEMLDLYKYAMEKERILWYDVEFMTKAQLIDVTPEGEVEWELEITPFYGNINGVMHGGAAAVIFDMATTACLCPVQKPGYWDFLGGVTRSLNISYLRAVPINTTVRIKSKLIQHGRTMALMRGTMESLDGKIIYATVEHHKVHVPSMPHHLEMRDEMRRAAELVAGKKSKL